MQNAPGRDQDAAAEAPERSDEELKAANEDQGSGSGEDDNEVTDQASDKDVPKVTKGNPKGIFDDKKELKKKSERMKQSEDDNALLKDVDVRIKTLIQKNKEVAKKYQEKIDAFEETKQKRLNALKKYGERVSELHSVAKDAIKSPEKPITSRSMHLDSPSKDNSLETIEAEHLDSPTFEEAGDKEIGNGDAGSLILLSDEKPKR